MPTRSVINMNSPDTERPAPAEAGAADAALPAASRALRTGVILALLGATALGFVGLRGAFGPREELTPQPDRRDPAGRAASAARGFPPCARASCA
jgi:hypothetical protein